MTKVTVQVDGMQCGMCEAHVNEALRNAFPGAKKVCASHKKGTATFVTETVPAESEIEKVIENTGYHFVSVKEEPYEKKGFFFH